MRIAENILKIILKQKFVRSSLTNLDKIYWPEHVFNFIEARTKDMNFL